MKLTQKQQEVITALENGATLKLQCVGNLYYMLDNRIVDSRVVKGLEAKGLIKFNNAGIYTLVK